MKRCELQDGMKKLTEGNDNNRWVTKERAGALFADGISEIAGRHIIAVFKS